MLEGDHGPLAPRTYWAHVARSPSKRALWDMSTTEILAGYYTPDERGLWVPKTSVRVDELRCRRRPRGRRGPAGCSS